MWKDITMPLHKNMAVWPGDTPFRYNLDATLAESGANVGSIQMSLHAGTHVDAPFHYDDFGKSIDTMPLDLFVGKVFIVDAIAGFPMQLFDELPKVERLFFKTKTTDTLHVFDDQYTAIPAEIVVAAVENGVKVIGTDAPSVDAFTSTTLPIHHLCKELHVTIIENLYLKDVAQGYYDFIGIPLAIQGGDASPIRAIIKKSEE